HAISTRFANANSQTSSSLDLSATCHTRNGLTRTPHLGYPAVKNNGDYSYTDYALTLAKDLGNGLSATAAVIGTDSSKAFYYTPAGKFTGTTGLVVGLKYSF
ncbi:MAG: TorF family putative porin, partial [Limnohabitans sp.]